MLNLILFVLLVGFIMWLVNKFAAPYVSPPFLTIANVVAVIVVVLYVLHAFGVLPFGDVAVPQLR